MEGDRRVAAERMEAEGKMEPKEELQRARAAYFTALETGDEVTLSPPSLPHVPLVAFLKTPRCHKRFSWICVGAKLV